MLDYRRSTRKALYKYYDGMALIMVEEYEGELYLMYSREWDSDMKNVSYMVMSVTEKEIEEFKKGVVAFLKKKKAEDEVFVYMMTYKKEKYEHHVYLMEEQDFLDTIPEKEFSIDYEYDLKQYSWVN